jgi:hypothetical protein
MTKNCFRIVLFAILIFPSTVFSQNGDGWIFKNEKNGIRGLLQKNLGRLRTETDYLDTILHSRTRIVALRCGELPAVGLQDY